MPEIDRYLFLAGALPFVVLGVAHAFATPRTPAEAKGLSPRDPALRDAMVRESVLLTRRTNLWLAWVGFNLSHSLGAVLFGALVLLIGRSPASFRAEAGVFLPLAVVVSGLYLVPGSAIGSGRPSSGSRCRAYASSRLGPSSSWEAELRCTWQTAANGFRSLSAAAGRAGPA